MARTRKPKSLEEQLEKVTCDIKTTQENLKKLKQIKKKLEKEKRINSLDRLDKVIGSEGISYEEAERRLRQTPDKI